MKSQLFFISLTLLIGCTPSFLWGQKTERQALVKSGKLDFAQWDQNGNGMLEEGEIPPKMRPMMKRWAQKLKLDTKEPLPINRFALKDGKRKQGVVGERKETKESRKKSKNGDDSVAKTQTSVPVARKVAGFGNASSQPDVGKKRQISENDAEQNAKGSDKKKSSSERRRERFQKMMTRSMMFQNDKNKNGKLERNEWSKLKGNPSASDVNKDGVLSDEELSMHLRGFGSREREVTRRPVVRSYRSQKNKAGKSYRALTPHERLPTGLPDWFVERDLNADGQLGLLEYAQEMSAANVAKFQQFDLNGDGMLVAAEYLKATN